MYLLTYYVLIYLLTYFKNQHIQVRIHSLHIHNIQGPNLVIWKLNPHLFRAQLFGHEYCIPGSARQGPRIRCSSQEMKQAIRDKEHTENSHFLVHQQVMAWLIGQEKDESQKLSPGLPQGGPDFTNRATTCSFPGSELAGS